MANAVLIHGISFIKSSTNVHHSLLLLNTLLEQRISLKST